MHHTLNLKKKVREVSLKQGMTEIYGSLKVITVGGY